MQHLLAILTSLVILLTITSIGCSRPALETASAEETVFYFISIGTDETTHDGTNVINPQGAADGMKITMVLNGHPLVFYWHKPIVLSASEFLVKGENTLQVTSALPADAYFRLDKRVGKSKVEPVTTWSISAGNYVETPHEIHFDAGVDYVIPYDSVLAESDRHTIRQECISASKVLYRLIKEEKYLDASRMFFSGEDIVARIATRKPTGTRKWEVEKQRQWWADPKYVEIEPQWNKVNFAYGKKSVLLYLGWNGYSSSPYFFQRAERDKSRGRSADVFRNGTLRLAKIDGKWVFLHW